MKKYLALSAIVVLLCGCSFLQPDIEMTTADKKLTELTQLDSGNAPAATDGMYIVDDFAGSAASRYVAVQDLMRAGMITKTVSGSDYTVGTDNALECYGGVIYISTAHDVIACDDLESGMRFSVIVTAAVAADVDVQSDDLMILDGTTLDDGDKATCTSTAGDMITCTYYDSTGWACQSNGWSDGS